MKEHVRVFAPATVANVGPGFDIFGFALENIGDFITLDQTDSNTITIEGGKGCHGLPTDPQKNIAGVAAHALLREYDQKVSGLHFHIEKNVKPGSGLGSSASSAAGAVYALNELLDRPFSTRELIRFAMEGEGAGSGTPHADNVSPALLGGFTIVRSYHPLDIIQIPFPDNIYVSIVHPQIEVTTAISKKMLKKEIPLSTAVHQWGNVAGMVAGLIQNDYQLIGRSMEDLVAEPVRSMLIPGFDLAVRNAKSEGAIGCGISGSGPSIFALSGTAEVAERVNKAFRLVFDDLDIEHLIYLSRINPVGAGII